MDELGKYSSLLTALAAAAAATFSSLAIKVDFPFDADHVRSIEARVAKGLALVVSVACTAWLLTDVGARSTLDRRRAWLAAATATLVLAVIAYLSVRAFTLYRLKGSGGQLKPYLGGLWLRQGAKKAVRGGSSVNALLQGKAANLDAVWSRSSRTMAYVILLVAGATTIVGSTTAATLGVHVATAARDYSRTVFAWIVNDYVDKWQARRFTNMGALPAEFRGSTEYIIALWPSRNQGLKGSVTSERLKECSELVKNFLLITQRHEERLEWFGRQHEYLRDVEPEPKLAIFARLEQVEALVSLLLKTAPDSPKFREFLNQAFKIVSDLQQESSLAPSQLTRLKYLRVVLHHKNAQIGRKAEVGIWDSAELAAAFQLANSLASDTGALSENDMGTVVNVSMRTLNEAGDQVSSRREAVEQGTALLASARARVLRARENVNSSNFGLVVNFAKLNEENILMLVYDSQPMTAEFPTDRTLESGKLTVLLKRLMEDTLVPLKLVQAHLRSESNWSQWANVTLDLARSESLLSELRFLTKAPDDQEAATTRAIGLLEELSANDAVEPALKRRLFTDPVNRPEFARIRTDARVRRILDYYSQRGAPGK